MSTLPMTRGVAPCGVHMDDRGYQRVFQYLRDLPGVEAPADGPAWEYAEEEEADAATASTPS